MKLALADIAANAASIVCIGAAIYLAAAGKQGWGYFLFVAVLLAGSVKIKGE